jgi:hypothetical protein
MGKKGFGATGNKFTSFHSKCSSFPITDKKSMLNTIRIRKCKNYSKVRNAV